MLVLSDSGVITADDNSTAPLPASLPLRCLPPTLRNVFEYHLPAAARSCEVVEEERDGEFPTGEARQSGNKHKEAHLLTHSGMFWSSCSCMQLYACVIVSDRVNSSANLFWLLCCVSGRCALCKHCESSVLRRSVQGPLPPEGRCVTGLDGR